MHALVLKACSSRATYSSPCVLVRVRVQDELLDLQLRSGA